MQTDYADLGRWLFQKVSARLEEVDLGFLLSGEKELKFKRSLTALKD